MVVLVVRFLALTVIALTVSGARPNRAAAPAVCAICRLSVHGVYNWCQGCGHGGHEECLGRWFKQWNICPTGCGHLCIPGCKLWPDGGAAGAADDGAAVVGGADAR